SSAHTQVAYGFSPHHSRTPTGMTPSERRKSWSWYPTETTRCGSASIVVEPYLCSMVTGKAPTAASVAASVAVASVEVVAVLVAVAVSDSPAGSESSLQALR